MTLDTIDTVMSELHQSKPKPPIYWEFIVKERNIILKEYAINAGQGVTINLATDEAKATYHYPITSGPFKGRDQREVLDEAIRWWEATLDRIDELSAS